MRALKRNLRSWREREWKGISREWKIWLLKGLVILALFLAGVSALCTVSGCAGDIGTKWTFGNARHEQSGQTVLSSGRSADRPARD